MPTASSNSSRYRLGWIPDVPDHRDRIYSAPSPASLALPPRVDLRPHCPPIYNQLNLGSCTANAIAGAMEFDQLRQHFGRPFTPSRLFIYYNERSIEQTIAADSGASLRDGVKSVAAQGVCPEGMWPYLDDGKTFLKKPAPACYQDAARHRAVSYARIPRAIEQLKGCLAAGFPFVFGFSVYQSFMSDTVAKTGLAPMPALDEPLLGGHAVAAVGYDDPKNLFIVRNSWGADWGLEGYFMMPYAYLLNADLSDDFWTIRVVK